MTQVKRLAESFLYPLQGGLPRSGPVFRGCLLVRIVQDGAGIGAWAVSFAGLPRLSISTSGRCLLAQRLRIPRRSHVELPMSR